MSNVSKTKTDAAWEKIFEKYNLLSEIKKNSYFQISARQIADFREPRLMAKFDHRINLPKLFADNNLVILPITRGDYVVAPLDAYHEFEKSDAPIVHCKLPDYLQSLNGNDIPSEAISLNTAFASGIISDFLQDERLLPTVSGRMGSGAFDFSIWNRQKEKLTHLKVTNAQIEIDAAYEGEHSLTLFEAKCDLSDDFLVRQLYYPFRLWKAKVTKPVRTVFLIYSNGIYHLFEYEFMEYDNYGSLILRQQKNYAIEDTRISIADLRTMFESVAIMPEPPIPFPQADSFERVINLCELLRNKDLSRNDVTEQYAFDARQTNYYTDAARYLGLAQKESNEDGTPIYHLTELGKTILNSPFKKRQLSFCRRILEHKVFFEAFEMLLNNHAVPDKKEIIDIMKKSELYHVGSDSTYVRRASTVRSWLEWMDNLANK